MSVRPMYAIKNDTRQKRMIFTNYNWLIEMDRNTDYDFVRLVG